MSASLALPFSIQSMKYRHAVDAVSSTEWMLPSIQYAGLSCAAPVAPFVSVTSGMSRPSWLRPIDSTVTWPGCSAAKPRSSAISSS